ncbi:hypothetical protein CsSME_00012645 [Camellia sinensis var. sinensis]
MVGDGQQHERKLKMWWPTTFDGPKTTKTSWPTRKLAGREESGLQGKELASHPCTTFQTRKTSGPLGQGNKAWFENQAKQRTLSGPKTRRAAEGSKNQKLVSERENWSTTAKSGLRPQKDGLQDHPLPPGKGNKAWSTNQVEAQRVQRPRGEAFSQNSGNSKRAQHALSPSGQSMTWLTIFHMAEAPRE